MFQSKVESTPPPPVKPFPKLMKAHDGLIVLFSKKRYGVVLVGSIDWDTGHRSSTWIMSKFTDYNEEITLQNT